MILVFGSINVDLLVPVPHLPVPGETVLGGDYRIAPGGKGANQALAARRAGAPVTMAGAVGRDSFAEIALSLLRRDGVDLSLVATTERPTGCATIAVDAAGENLIAVASCANLLVTAAQVPDRLLGPETVLVLQREVPIAENAALIGRARERGARIVLNLAPAGPIAPARLADIDFLIANEGDQGLALDLALRRASAAAALACLAVGAQEAMPDRAAIDAAVARLHG
jgi:ribokinase